MTYHYDVQTFIRYRMLRGWSQQRLADESGIHRVTITKMESGKHRLSPATAGKLAGALGFDLEEALREEEEDYGT